MGRLDEPALVEWRLFQDDLVRNANQLVHRLELDQFTDAQSSLEELRYLINNESKHLLLERHEQTYGPFGGKP